MSEALDSITISGFRSIAQADVELRPINILIGANGSGKSNFLAVFSFLRALRDGHLRQTVAQHGGANRVLHFGVKSTPYLRLAVSFAEGTNAYAITLGATAVDGLFPAAEVVTYHDKRTGAEPHEHELTSQSDGEAGIGDPAQSGVAQWVRHRLGMWRTYHFHDTSSSAPLRQTADLNDNRVLRPDGSNLAAFIYLLEQRHSAAYSKIRYAARRVMPFFDDFALAPLALRPDAIRLQWRHKGSDQLFDVSSLSDGSMRFIALATLLLQPPELRPRIILIDEPELGLHPTAITLLASLVKMASTTAQVIVSTQSSLFLDNFDPQDVLVAERNNNATEFRRLDPDKLRDWLEEFSLGELWDKNELGGRP